MPLNGFSKCCHWSMWSRQQRNTKLQSVALRFPEHCTAEGGNWLEIENKKTKRVPTWLKIISCSVKVIVRVSMSTHLNQNSSRSHNIFSILLVHLDAVPGQAFPISGLTVCDLVRSERAVPWREDEGSHQHPQLPYDPGVLYSITALRQNQNNSWSPQTAANWSVSSRASSVGGDVLHVV